MAIQKASFSLQILRSCTIKRIPITVPVLQALYSKCFCDNLRYYSDNQGNRNHHNKNFKHKSIVFGTWLMPIVCLSLYNWYDRRKSATSKFNFPVIFAGNVPDTPQDLRSFRNKYNFIADVVEISAPSVVNIDIIDKNRPDYFSGRSGPSSNGSGFIIKEDGLILTNAHVVLASRFRPHAQVEVHVRLHDGSTHSGTVEYVDVNSDLATVRINKKNLPAMKLGSSAKLRPGEFVVAIGSPLSLSNSITTGVVSNVNRQSQELGLHNRNINYIQTDAAITFGHSGGPLVNLDGEAIGINSMKITAGISFAIPIDYAKEFLKKAEESQKKGKFASKTDASSVRKRCLGVTILSLTPDILNHMQYHSGGIFPQVTHGVYISRVVMGSSAHRSGIEPGDIITHVNGQKVHTSQDLYRALESPGPLDLTMVKHTGMVIKLKVDPEEI